MKKATAEAKYSCFDHPNVKSSKAGKCGKCGEKMKKVSKKVVIKAYQQ
jgi:hypothetical protein